MYAIIDVGSNSVRLMLGEKETTISKSIMTTRLGEGLAATGKLKREKIEITAKAVDEFVNSAKKFGVHKNNIFVFATESVRSAINGKEFVDEVYALSRVNVDVISGEIEAKLGFNGAYSGSLTEAVIDIGGASTEITVGNENGIIYSCSRPIGCVRIRDKCGEDRTSIGEYAKEILDTYGTIPKVDKAIFVAGTASTVAMMALKEDIYDSSKVQGIYVSKEKLKKLTLLVENTPQEVRYTIKGLSEGRRDIIYGGMILIEAILEKMNLDGFYFSDRDNLEGYCKHLIDIGKIII